MTRNCIYELAMTDPNILLLQPAEDGVVESSSADHSSFGSALRDLPDPKSRSVISLSLSNLKQIFYRECQWHLINIRFTERFFTFSFTVVLLVFIFFPWNMCSESFKLLMWCIAIRYNLKLSDIRLYFRDIYFVSVD